jgi:clan AA aspartic protease (TIGR02281 family)
MGHMMAWRRPLRPQSPGGLAASHARSMDGSSSTHLLTLLAGIALGVAVTVMLDWRLRASDRAATTGPASQFDARTRRTPASVGLAPLASTPRVELLTRAGRQHATTGLLIREVGDGSSPPIRGVIVPLESLYDAEVARISTDDGTAIPLMSVAGVSGAYGLALLALPAQSRRGGLAPARQSPALHLGRTLTVVGAAGRRQATVDSAARQDAFGAYSFALRTGTVLAPALGALVDQRDQLLGLSMPSPWRFERGAPPLIATDLEPVMQLLEAATLRPPRPLAAFSREFFRDEPPGQLVVAQAHADANDWVRVVESLRPLVHQGPPWGDAALPVLDRAYGQLALMERSTRGGDERALAWIQEAAEVLGWTPQRRLLAAQLRAAQGELDDSLALIRSGLAESAGNPDVTRTLRNAARTLLDQAIVDGSVQDSQLIEMLRMQLQDDDEYAGYHAALGRLLFRAGRYADALPSLYRARSMSVPEDRPALSDLIARAEARAWTSGLTVVPVMNQGATLYVYGRIPGTADQLRFILDTGASITALSSHVVDRLRNVRTRGSVTLQTANGQVDAPLITITGLDIAGARVNDLDVVVIDSLSGFDGLLGLSFLDHFNMNLDRNRNELTLELR